MAQHRIGPKALAFSRKEPDLLPLEQLVGGKKSLNFRSRVVPNKFAFLFPNKDAVQGGHPPPPFVYLATLA